MSWNKRFLYHGAHLTQRQIDVCELTAIALTNKDIAKELGISESSIKSHMNNIFKNPYFCSIGVTGKIKLLRHILAGPTKDEVVADIAQGGTVDPTITSLPKGI